MIFNFDDYRDFLRTYFTKLPKQGYGEAKKVATHLGVSSTFVSQIFSGQKDLNLEQADLLTEYLGLSAIEKDYFFLLVEKQRAGTKRLKTYWVEKISELRKSSLQLAKRVNPNRVLSDEEKSIFYSSSLYSAIHLYTSTKGNGRTLEEVCRRFEIERLRGNEVLKFLVDVGLCSEKNGVFLMTENHTHVGKGSPHLLKHHANWRIKAVQYAEELDDEELMYTANVSLSEKDFTKLREQMVQFIKTFIDQVKDSPAEEIATFNMDFMWVRK